MRNLTICKDALLLEIKKVVAKRIMDYLHVFYRLASSRGGNVFPCLEHQTGVGRL